MATAEQLAAFQTAVASGNIQEAANIAASAGYSPQQVAEYVNANAPILGLGPETGFSGVTAANLDPYFAAASAPVVAAPPPPPVVVQEQGDPLKGALALYDQYLLAGQYPEAKALLDSTIATYGLNPTESYANIATYLNTEPKFEGVRKAAENKLFTSENIANFGKLSPAAPVGPAGGIYQRTPQEQAAYASQLASIPVNTAVPLPVMPMSLGPSAAMARIQRTGEMTPDQYYSNIRESVSSGQYTPAQLRQMQQGVGASSQDINVAFGRGMTPITTTTPTMPGATADTTQSIGQFIQSRAPTTSVAMPTAPSMFSPENVRAQLELERLRLQPTPEEPVAGFAQGGLVGDDINRMLQNQRNAIQRESQSRQMLNTLGAPPVKKFSDGGPAGSSSGVRRLKMSGYQEGGEVTDEMFVGTAPSDESLQTTGEYLKEQYKENIPVHARVYLETLLGKKDPVTADDFTKEELADIEKLLASKPAKGAVTRYKDYEKLREPRPKDLQTSTTDFFGRDPMDWMKNLPSVGKTLGRFTYETLPDGRRVITDNYDFYNTSRAHNVQEFEEMGPAEKALAVLKKITAERSLTDPPFVKRAADVLGEAYIGREGRPVRVEYDPKDLPVKRQEGSPVEGEMADDMFVGTRPTDETTRPGILPPELREAIDVPLDLANLAIRGTVGAVAGPAYGLYKGLTSEDFGTKKGVAEARSEAERMMGEITGEPKTQAGKDIMQFVGEKLEAAKIPPMPQFLTTPVPGPGSASALMRSYELAETPPLGTVKLAGDKGAKPATPPTDPMGFYSPAEKAVMNLPQDKGTASQMLAQITKTQGVKPVELRATGLEDYLKGKGNEPVTKQEIQDFLTNNRVQVDEVVLGKGLSLSPEAKRLMGDAEKRMMKADQVMAPFFEQQEAGSLLQGQEPYSTFYRIRGPLSRKIAGGDKEALAELDALNLPPDIGQAVLDFGAAKTEYIKYSSQARRMEKSKFDGYNIPGGTNAREIYLTLPESKGNFLSTAETARLDELSQKRIGSSLDGLSPAEQSEYFSLIGKREKAGAAFTAPSAHAVSPEADKNRLAHIFLDERKDAKGDKVLFVQEMQSDWAQTGRDKGFAKTFTPDQLKAEEVLPKPPGPPVWRVTYPDGNQSTFAANTADEAIASAIQREGTIGSPPSAPFVTNTEDWVNLALKRVIKEAVDNDIDTVAFIKGGQAADKYSLRTFVDQITADRGFATGDDLYVSITPKNSLSPHAFYVGPDGVIKEPISADVRSKFLGEPLSKVIGKEAAEKLLSTEVGKSQVLKDEGLTLGGKGMEGFYDNILPKTAEKLLKKLGGGKVEPVEVVKGAPSQMPFEANAFLDWMEQNHPGTKRSDAARAWGMGMDNNQFVKEFYEATKADQYLGFKITPEMKEMVKTEGLPKFAAGGEVTDFIKRAA